MLAGKDLIADIDRCHVKPGQVAAWWLGQHSFVFKLPSGVLYLDAFLSPLPDRLVPSLLRPEEITHAAWVLGTHDHADHIDRGAWPAIAAASPDAKFIVPDLLLPALAADLKIDLGRFTGLDDGKTARLAADVRVTGIAAAHEFLDPDKATGRHPYLGYVIEAGGCTFYHSGDCCVYEGLLARLRRWRIDAMFLPINGRDARRLAAGIIGNMTYQEAADLAGAAGTPWVVPTHYDMFATNLGAPNAFLDYVRVKYPAMRTHCCQYGQRFLLGGI